MVPFQIAKNLSANYPAMIVPTYCIRIIAMTRAWGVARALQLETIEGANATLSIECRTASDSD
jgi:hypothetical protein